MRCAIYVRRSTEEQDASITVQLDLATCFITSQGWTVSPGHTFVDDAISRAEFKKRPGLIAMVAAAEAKEFDAVVMRDETRLGGDMVRATLALSTIVESGVRIFHYEDGREVRFNRPEDKLLVSVRNFAAELEREKIASRTREHLAWRAKKGFNVGGRCYGYENIRVEGEHRHVEYRINEEQSPVVVRIFESFSAAQGLRAIAKMLNAEGVPSCGLNGENSWSPSRIREMLMNERYRGVLVWGRNGKEYKGGTRVRVERPKSQHERIEREDLRIVPEELWLAVQERLKKTAINSGGRRKGPPPRYLLSGILRCSACGGPMHAANGKLGATNVKFYTCSWHRNRGDEVCRNSSRGLVERVDDAFIVWIEEHVLHEQVIIDALEEVRRRLAERSATADAEIPRLEKQVAKITQELRRLTKALATTDDAPHAVLEEVRVREKARMELDARLQALRAAPGALELEVRRLEREARKRASEFRRLLRRNPDEARKAVEALLDGPLKAETVDTPEGRRFHITGAAVVGPVSLGTLITTVGDPSGNRRARIPRVSRRQRRVRRPINMLLRAMRVTRSRRRFRYGPLATSSLATSPKPIMDKIVQSPISTPSSGHSRSATSTRVRSIARWRSSGRSRSAIRSPRTSRPT
jgi:site-specific DNA recombinase